MKQGETLALNERIMLSLVSTGVSASSFETNDSDENQAFERNTKPQTYSEDLENLTSCLDRSKQRY